MLDNITLIKVERTQSDYGGEITKEVVVRDIPANVEFVGGSRLAWYKSQGYTKPLTIRYWEISEPYDVIRYNGELVAIQSKNVDEDNNLKVVVMGDIVSREI